jgi:DNA-binding transcriptional LysR family regulator
VPTGTFRPMAASDYFSLTAEPLSARDLVVFVAAMESGSVQGAADALTMTQSAASKRLQALERRLGATLLERSRTGVTATDLGRRLYPEARQALAALARAERAARPTEAARRVLTLAASHTVGEVLLPAWLAAYRLTVSEAELQVQVDVVNSPTVIHRVRQRTVDVGFVEGLDALTGLDVLTVARDELVAVVGSQHRWARRRSVRARELLGEPYITRESGSGTRAVTEAAFAQVGVRLEPALEVASLQSVKRTLSTGGVAVISRATVAEELRAGVLCALPVSDVTLTRELRAVRRLRPAPARAARDFWEWLTSRATA